MTPELQRELAKSRELLDKLEGNTNPVSLSSLRRCAVNRLRSLCEELEKPSNA